MRMRNFFLQLVILLGLFFVTPFLNNVFAASLQFDPTTVSTTTGQTFSLKVNMNAGTDQVLSTDIYINYDQTLLEAQKVDSGTFFPSVSNTLTVPGKVYIAGMVEDPATSKTGSGTIATITFKAKKDGSIKLAFNCGQGSSSDSHIIKNDFNSTDIIQCSVNGTSTITIGSGSGTSATNTPTPSPTPTTASSSSSSSVATPTPTPTTLSQLPKSGTVAENISFYAAIGAVLFMVGIGAKLLL